MKAVIGVANFVYGNSFHVYCVIVQDSQFLRVKLMS